MKITLACLLALLCVAAASTIPALRTGQRGPRNTYPMPARTMMFTGYFRGHHYPRPNGGVFRHYSPRTYEPEGAMTAFAAGNTVSAGSYYGANGQPVECGQCNGYGNGHGNDNGNGNGNSIPAGDEAPGSPPEVIPVNGGNVADDPEAYPADDPQASAPEAPLPEEPSHDEPKDIPEEATASPADGNEYEKGYGNGHGNGNGNGNGHNNGNGNGNGHSNGNGNGNGKKNGNGNGGRTTPHADDDDDDYSDEDETPFLPGKRSRGRGNFYNTYFPMIFGGYPGGRSGASGSGTPGVATAIANSFSRGRGAVATSHATAYGGPHLLGNGSRKSGSRRSSS